MSGMERIAFFGATIADMDLPVKLAFALSDVFNPTTIGAGVGGLAGYGIARATVDKRDPDFLQKKMLASLLGAGAGGLVGRTIFSGSEDKPDSKVTELVDKVKGKYSTGELTNNPIPPAKGITPSVRSQAATPSQIEQRLRSSEDAIRQQAQQAQHTQQVQRASAEESARLLKDRARVETRLKHLTAPGGPPAGTFVISPAGSVQFRPAIDIQLSGAVANTGPGRLAKTSQDSSSLGTPGEWLAKLKAFIASNPAMLAGGLGGSALGVLSGWSAPKDQRSRKMLSHALIGGALGAGGGHAIDRLARTAQQLGYTASGVESTLREGRNTLDSLNRLLVKGHRAADSSPGLFKALASRFEVDFPVG